MKLTKFFIMGLFFGIVLTKAEVVSWFRIQEMFHFQSIHMFGIIGSAIAVGILTTTIIRVFKLKTIKGETIKLEGKPFNKVGNLVGGSIFGLGWAMTGACPGPLYALLGAGYYSFFFAILSAMFGVWVYALLKPKLPH
ncbi:DUF6691 family protein [Spirochaeta cellobiosiphila]|uniref:DUF6691 family protein n=1 Tax=Spirochaeta cellobiosiphila TaxID=504483 RepID=UPI00040AB7AF|nr:DUF6691 family protein [Spirochaeta cellobiosiphila]